MLMVIGGEVFGRSLGLDSHEKGRIVILRKEEEKLELTLADLS
jgi:hypothetical protein